MSIIASEQEQNIANALIQGLANLPETPTLETVEEKAKKLAAVFDYSGDLRNIITIAMISVDTRMGAGVSLVDRNAVHDEQWVQRLTGPDWYYTGAYEGHLRGEGWPPQMVHALSDVTLRILGHLQDPQSDGTTWNRRGLVIGHVQSGKTANYTGLVARAADAGYKFIIIIAGIHNNLRRQTQERIDEAFIGRSSDPADRKPIGVGRDKAYRNPVTLTNIYEDFDRGTAEISGWKINDFSKPIIIVIKKNVVTLNALHDWLKELNAGTGDGRISDVPMLLIDDEADNASINTAKDDINPTQTNAMIRKILRLFAKSCYVGYTATPFANIFINPDAYNKEVYEELFPRDFIYCLDAPTTYFGAGKVFLSEESSERIVEEITDAEEFLPFAHKGDFQPLELPPSLYDAVYEFIVARAIRNLRGQANKHCSMMINVSRFVSVQRSVRNLLSLRIQHIRDAVRLNYKMPEASSSTNSHMKMLKEAYETHYSDAVASWPYVKSELSGVFDHLQVFVINSKSDEVLDFRKYVKDGVGLTAIAVGGLSLSRGLTIEGLTVSYMYRNTKMYDTLMQMGRWFGYRPGYEDLCRVHLAPDSIDWYAQIANAAEELVQQVKRMRRDGLSPRQFGLYVTAQPHSPLVITAANKMRNTESVMLSQNFSGLLRESYVVSTDPFANNANFELLNSMWRNNFGGCKWEPTEKGPIFREVDTAQLEDYLVQFQSHPEFAERKQDIIAYLRKMADLYPKSEVLLVSPGKIKTPFILGTQQRAAVKVKNVDGTAWTLSKGRVASRGDEQYGLTDPQLKEAMQEALRDASDPEVAKRRRSDGPVVPSDLHYRRVRKLPLLMIHSLEPKDNEELKKPVAAFGVSFPSGHYDLEIKIQANKVWLANRMKGPADDPDDEDDYDE